MLAVAGGGWWWPPAPVFQPSRGYRQPRVVRRRLSTAGSVVHRRGVRAGFCRCRPVAWFEGASGHAGGSVRIVVADVRWSPWCGGRVWDHCRMLAVNGTCGTSGYAVKGALRAPSALNAPFAASRMSRTRLSRRGATRFIHKRTSAEPLRPSPAPRDPIHPLALTDGEFTTAGSQIHPQPTRRDPILSLASGPRFPVYGRGPTVSGGAGGGCGQPERCGQPRRAALRGGGHCRWCAVAWIKGAGGKSLAGEPSHERRRRPASDGERECDAERTWTRERRRGEPHHEAELKAAADRPGTLNREAEDQWRVKPNHEAKPRGRRPKANGE